MNIMYFIKEEINALKSCNKLLFIDTDALTTKFYGNFLLNDKEDIKKCNDLANAITQINEFAFVFRSRYKLGSR